MFKLFAYSLLAFSLFVSMSPFSSLASEPVKQDTGLSLTPAQASHFARLVLKSIQREYPNKLEHVLNDASQAQTPRALHPAFYGCFDWHSSVHGHWLLAHLLRLFPDLAEAPAIRAALNADLTQENLAVEAAYFTQPGRQSFERTYGWAWLLRLDEELRGWNDPQARIWTRNLEPLTEVVIKKYLDFLPKQQYPIRTGVHPNTAFGLTFALDYARSAGNTALETLIVERSRTYYFADTNYPSRWEPGGEDFLSPALTEADLMRRVLSPPEFKRWFARFLPALAKGKGDPLLEPVQVTDRADPKLVHLDGLNLSRAWCLRSIASTLAPTDPLRKALAESARRHAQATLPYVASGGYAGEHWLATFAVTMLTTPVP